MDIKRFRKKYHLSNADIVRIVKYKYPRFCKYALCMVSDPKGYGVQLTPGAEDTLMSAVDKKKPNRKKNHQLTVRVDDELYYVLMRYCETENMTVQDALELLIKLLRVR